MVLSGWPVPPGGVFVIPVPGGGVGFDVEPGQFQVRLIADNMVIIIPLPDGCSRHSAQQVDPFGDNGFKLTHNGTQRTSL